MIVEIKGGQVTLTEADDLKAFKVAAPTAARTDGTLATTLSSIGRLDGDVVWVSEAWLRGETAGRPADWIVGFEKMLAFAKSKGWYDAATGAVRAHIEWGA